VASISEGSIAPSESFQTLNAGAFAINYPQNWQVYQNGQTSVVIAPPAGVSENAIAYGVLIGGFNPQSGNLEQATEQVLSSLSRSNPGMRASGQAERGNINGVPAIQVELQGQSPLADRNGGPATERDVLVTTQRGDGAVIWMLFIAPEAHFNALKPTFQQMINSLRVG
jgi:hypothetical protein